MASVVYGSPLSFMGPAFWDIDKHPGNRPEPASPTTPLMPRSRANSYNMLNDSLRERRDKRSMTDSWETLRGAYVSQGISPVAISLQSKDAPIPVYAAPAPPPGEGFFSHLCRKIGEMFS